MKRTFLKVGAATGVASVAVLAAGPAMAASTYSQASAQALQLNIATTAAISQQVTATNTGGTETKNSANTVPQLSDLLPTNTLLGLGVAPQDAFANADGTSSACAGLAGQGGGIVQTGSAPCKMNQGMPVTLNLANITLGTLLAANNSAALTPLTSALQAVFGPLNTAAVDPILSALKAIPISADIVLDGVGAYCQASPGQASGGAGIAHLGVDLTIAGSTLRVINLQANGDPNEKLVANLATSTTTLTNAIDKALLGALTPTAPGGALSGLSGLSAVTGALSTVLGTIQTALLDPVGQALTPLTSALSANVLEVTFNKQPVQTKGRFEATALDLQVLPAAKAAIGASLISGDIGHVICGPNTLATHVTPTPTPSKTPSNNVPKNIDSGLGGGNNTGTIIAAMSVLLAAGGAAGATAYRRYWMPRG